MAVSCDVSMMTINKQSAIGDFPVVAQWRLCLAWHGMPDFVQGMRRVCLGEVQVWGGGQRGAAGGSWYLASSLLIAAASAGLLASVHLLE
jgi:hypothetical protein